MRRLASIAALVVTALLGVVATGSSSGAGAPYQVRAVFDNAAFAVPGEDVRVAGAPIGRIKAVDLTSDRKQAAVTLEIDNSHFTPFHADATCAIRPQSLIGERYVDCLPGSSSTTPLTRIASGPGAGTYELPVTRTSSPVDSDIVQSIYQQPIRERFALILNELGTGLAARGSDLNTVIHRANPALGDTDKVLQILAAQNRALAQLARDSDAVLAPLAQVRSSISGFVVHANTTSVASAERAADISRSFQLFPAFLQQLKPLLVDLGNLADQGTPLMAELGQSASAVGRQFENLTPFAKAARPALIDLGNSSAQSQPALLRTIPLAQRLLRLGNASVPTATSLDRLLSSFDNTGGFEQLMALLFNGATAGNGFDQFGHYVRDEILTSGSCVQYATNLSSLFTCSSRFNSLGGTSDVASARSAQVSKVARIAGQASHVAAQTTHVANEALKGLMLYLIGTKP